MKRTGFLLMMWLAFLGIALGELTQNDSMEQRTKEAWNAYQTMRLPAGQYWEQFVFKRDALRRLNLQGVDPDLITYYRLLDQQLAEEIPVVKAWEAEEAKEEDNARQEATARDEDCQRAHELHEPCEHDGGDALSVLQDFLKFSGRPSGGSGAAGQKWRPVYDRIEAKYNPSMAVVLKRLEIRYQTDYYSIIFDGKANEFYRSALEYFDQKKYAEAVVQLKWALRVNPNHLLAHQSLAFCYRMLGQYELTIVELQEAARRNVYPDAQYGIGQSYIELKRYAEAVGPLQAVIRLNPADADAHEELGYSLQQLGRFNEAIEQYQAVLKQKPGFPLAHYHLGQIYNTIGNRSTALGQYRILQTLDAELATKLYEEINKGR